VTATATGCPFCSPGADRVLRSSPHPRVLTARRDTDAFTVGIQDRAP